MLMLVAGEVCDYEYCWLCLTDYGPRRDEGNEHHALNCKSHSENLLLARDVLTSSPHRIVFMPFRRLTALFTSILYFPFYCRTCVNRVSPASIQYLLYCSWNISKTDGKPLLLRRARAFPPTKCPYTYAVLHRAQGSIPSTPTSDMLSQSFLSPLMYLN